MHAELVLYVGYGSTMSTGADDTGRGDSHIQTASRRDDQQDDTLLIMHM